MPEDSGPRPFVAPPAFTVDSPAYQARAWDMWEPGGTSRSDQRGGFGNGRVRDAGNSYVVIFDYGSVIFLHFNQHQQEVGGIGSRRRGSGGRKSGAKLYRSV